MVTKDMRLIDIINNNHQASQVLMALRIGCSEYTTNENMTLEEACIRHGINLDYAINHLNFKSYY